MTGRLAASMMLVWASGSAGADLPVTLPPQAEATGQIDDSPGRYGVASEIWTGAEVPFAEINGTRRRMAFRMPDHPGALADLIAAVSDTLDAAGFEILLSCTDRTCGGFDFRQRLDVLPLPEMYVDLGSFRYVSGRQVLDDGTENLIALLGSASGDVLFLQIDFLEPLPVAPQEPAMPAVSEVATDPAPDTVFPESDTSDLADVFAETGEFVLEDLTFPSGARALSAGNFASLAVLATYLTQTPDARIALVGHTDSTGSLAGNVAVSRARARSVADRLVQEHGVARDRLIVEGVGYLAPRADNRTEAGRARNRRVVAVLVPSS